MSEEVRFISEFDMLGTLGSSSPDQFVIGLEFSEAGFEALQIGPSLTRAPSLGRVAIVLLCGALVTIALTTTHVHQRVQ